MLQLADSAAPLNDRGLSVAPIFISNADVGRRFGVSGETLKRWRAAGTGPRFTRLGKRIKYRLDDVLAFEADRTFESSADESASRIRLVSSQPSPRIAPEGHRAAGDTAPDAA